jgi:prepilin-type N-terminal cleavage/methylation domain-containing protein
MHSLSHHRRLPNHRAGFTLVEMLISITIFVILATISLSAFRDSKHDKVASASRQLVASINGARSRAAKTVEPRGIRLLRDKTDWTLITGIQYIGQAQIVSGNARVQINANGNVQLRLPGGQSGDWAALRNEGLLKPGARIRLPADEFGRWYVISTQGFSPDTDTLQIVGLIDHAEWNERTGLYELDPVAPATAQFQGTAGRSNSVPIPYLLRLSAQELPETEPILFPPGVVIDLQSSIVPSSWLTFEDTNQNGELDSNENDGVTSAPGWDNSNGILDDITFDIPVSPNGTVSGPLTGAGPITLYFCTRDDVDRMRSMPGYVSGAIPGDFENYTDPDHPSSERKVVTLIPQTGLLYVSDVNGADGQTSGAGYRYADNPFSYARAGKEGR